MASYEKRGTKWTVRFRLDGQKRLSGFDTKKDAEQAYVKALAVNNQSTTALTLQNLFELYKNYKRLKVKESSYISFMQTLETYVLPYFAKTKLDNLTTNKIAEWQGIINALPIKFKTKDKIYVTFVNLINYAISFHGLPFNPVSKVGNFKNTEIAEPMDFWTETEFEQFIAVIDDLLYKTLFATLYLTGIRKGELIALNWQDINLAQNTISITKTYTRKVLGGGYALTSPKSKSSNRIVLIPQTLANLLKRLQDEQCQQVGYTKKCFVFGFSRPLPTSNIDHQKRRYCTLSGVKPIRIHDFRHSHASLLINKGHSALLVAQRLGHSDINMTLNTYSHLFPNKEQEFINSMNITID